MNEENERVRNGWDWRRDDDRDRDGYGNDDRRWTGSYGNPGQRTYPRSGGYGFDRGAGNPNGNFDPRGYPYDPNRGTSSYGSTSYGSYYPSPDPGSRGRASYSYPGPYGRSEWSHGTYGHAEDWNPGFSARDDDWNRGTWDDRFRSGHQNLSDMAAREDRWRRSMQGGTGTGRAYGFDEGRHIGKGPRGYRRSDERIHEEISDALTRHPHVDASDIEVKVESGEVTLTGTVDDRYQKRSAEMIAEGIDGVHDVHNQIRVQKPPPEAKDLGPTTGWNRNPGSSSST